MKIIKELAAFIRENPVDAAEGIIGWGSLFILTFAAFVIF